MRKAVRSLLPAKAIHGYRVLRHLHLRPFEPELRLVPQFLGRDKIAIDIGANVGLYSTLLTRHSKRVIAFEPNPGCARHLRRIALSRCDVIEKALSDRTGTTLLRVPIGASGEMHALSTIETANTFETASGNGGEAEYRIATVSLDDELASHLTPGDKVGFIKIDVEGHELAVLRGGARTLSDHRPVLLIEHELRHGADTAGTFSLLADLGYRALALTDDGSSLASIDAAEVSERQRFDQLERKLTHSSRAGYLSNIFFLPD